MFLIRDVVSGDPTLSTTLGRGVTHYTPAYTPAGCHGVEPESYPGQLVGEALRILLTKLTGDIASKITEDHDRGEG